MGSATVTKRVEMNLTGLGGEELAIVSENDGRCLVAVTLPGMTDASNFSFDEQALVDGILAYAKSRGLKPAPSRRSPGKPRKKRANSAAIDDAAVAAAAEQA